MPSIIRLKFSLIYLSGPEKIVILKYHLYRCWKPLISWMIQCLYYIEKGLISDEQQQQKILVIVKDAKIKVIPIRNDLKRTAVK